MSRTPWSNALVLVLALLAMAAVCAHATPTTLTSAAAKADLLGITVLAAPPFDDVGIIAASAQSALAAHTVMAATLETTKALWATTSPPVAIATNTDANPAGTHGPPVALMDTCTADHRTLTSIVAADPPPSLVAIAAHTPKAVATAPPRPEVAMNTWRPEGHIAPS